MLFILTLFGIRLSVVTENLKVINFPKLIFILHFKVTPFKILFQIYYMLLRVIILQYIKKLKFITD